MAPGPLAILGGSGFLGAHVALRALARGEPRVVVVSGDPFVHPRSSDPRLERVRADLAQPGWIEGEFARLGASRVILCAAISRIADCERDAGKAMQVNGLVPQAVAAVCAELDARLVHVSTDLVFGRHTPPKPSGFREGDAPAPVSVYGQSKALGEQVAELADARVVVARLPLLYGDSFGRGQGATDSLFAALERGERPVLFCDEFRTPLHVQDAADALLELTELDYRGVLHVAGPERLDRVKLALAALRARGLSEADARSKIRIGVRADLDMQSTRPADVSLDSSKARALLRTPFRSVTDALRR